MWIINSARSQAINAAKIKSLQVNPMDEDGSCYMIEPDEIVAYGVFDGIYLIAGPYTSQSKANEVMIDIVCSVYREDPFYCPEGDYKGEENA